VTAINTTNVTGCVTAVVNCLLALWDRHVAKVPALFNKEEMIFFFTTTRCAWRSEFATNHVTRHNTPIHNNLSKAAQLSISQKALSTLPEDGNVMPKYVGATINN
jgi:hypothetical protein